MFPSPNFQDISSFHAGFVCSSFIGLLYAGYALCLFGFYSVMTFVVLHSSATSVTLGLLTSDIYSLFIGRFLFGYKFSGLYILSFILIIVGFAAYNSMATYTSESHKETENNDTEEMEAPPESATPLENVSKQLCTVIGDSAQ
ncbi:hypothetical protein AB205_0021220 [Aquarana catesbeiana]|uniref:Uncharacterized protein n=1 Tax=Aquarana catesbeiana TaxID=8400 RepID=A0A2G9RVW8_AQUCT|nr:hypothetical protein AB205_0021220 [Aquarana catesbeiana]